VKSRRSQRGLVEGELLYERDASPVVERRRYPDLFPVLIVERVCPSPRKVDLPPRLRVDVHARIGADEGCLTVFADYSLTKRGDAWKKAKKSKEERENGCKTLSFSCQFSTRAMDEKTGRMIERTRETLMRI
jgi:hypothetical protein